MIRERTGTFTGEEIWAVRKTGSVDRTDRGMDLLLVAELSRLTPQVLPGVRLIVKTDPDRSDTFDIAVEDLDGYPLARGPDMALRVAVTRAYEWTEESDGGPWTRLGLTITRLEQRSFRYEMQLRYEG